MYIKSMLMVFFFNFAFIHLVYAQNINVVSEQWARATDKDGHGLYWDILRAVYDQPGQKLSFKNTSYARSIKQLEQNKADIVLGSAKDEVETALYPEYPMDLDHVYVLYKASTSWHDKNSLAGKNVGWIKDYGYDKELDVKFTINEFLSLSVGLKRLLRDELDFIIDAKLDLDTAIDEARLDRKLIKLSTVFNVKTYPAFANTDKGKELLAIYNQRMPQLLADGTIKRLFEKYSWPTYPY
jgi:polar amino acid transport system substrate-binding protein